MRFAPKHILVATDFSEHARAAADAAVELAKQYGAVLRLLHVVPMSSYLGFMAGTEAGTLTAARLKEAVLAQAEQNVREEARRLARRGARVELERREGAPAMSICDCSHEAGFDLIVIGTHGRTGVKRLLLGSVAEQVVRHAAVPVLTVPLPSAGAAA